MAQKPMPKGVIHVEPFGWDRIWTKEETKKLRENIHEALEKTGDKLKDIWKGHCKVDSGLTKATIGKFTPGDIVDAPRAADRAGGHAPAALAVWKWEDWNKLVAGNNVSYGDVQNAQAPRLGGPGIQYAKEQSMVETEAIIIKNIEDALTKTLTSI